MTRVQRTSARHKGEYIFTISVDLGDAVASRQLQDVVEATAIISRTDSAGRIIYVNENFCTLTGYAPTEVLGRDHRLLNAGYHPAAFWEGLWATISAGNIWREEVCNRNKQGACYWVNTTIAPCRDRHGEIVSYIAIGHDITATKNQLLQQEASTRRLHAAMRLTGIGLIEVDTISATVMMERELLTLLQEEDLTPRQLPVSVFAATYFHPDDQRDVGDILQYGRAEQPSRQEEFKLITSRQQVRDVAIRHAWQQDGRTIFILQDVTERKQAQYESLVRGKQLGNILNSITEGFFAVDRQWNFVLCNQLFAKANGFSPEQLYGRNMWDTFPFMLQTPLYEAYQQAMASGQPRDMEVESYDGNAYYEVHACPFQEGLFVYYRDITPRKIQEAELRRHALVIRHTTSGVMMTDDQYRITWVNEAFERITGYKSDEVLGRTPSFLTSNNGLDVGALRLLNRAREHGQPVRGEEINYNRKGNRFWSDTECIPVFDDHHRLNSFMVIMSDISVLKTAIQEMLKSQSLLQTMMDNAPIQVFMKDPQGRYTFYNQSFIRSFPSDYSRSLITDFDIFPREDAINFRSSDLHVLATGDTLALEQDIVFKGKPDSYYTVKFPLRDDDQNIYAVGGVALCITERRAAELALQDSRLETERRNQLLEIINVAQQQFIKDVSPTIFFEVMLQNILKFTDSKAGLIGEVLPEGKDNRLKILAHTDISWNQYTDGLYFPFVEAAHELNSLKDLFGEVLRQRAPVICNNPAVSIETDNRDVEVTTALLGIPIFKGQEQVGILGLANRVGGYPETLIRELSPLMGVLGGIIEAIHNDEQRKVAEQGLRESEERFRVLADSAPVMIWMTDVSQRLEYCNKIYHDFIGTSLAGIQAGQRYHYVHAEDILHALKTIRHGLDLRLPFQVEYRMLRQDGLYRWVVDHGSPRYLPNGDFIGFIGTIMDIHERKLAEQSLAESEARYRSIVDDQQEMICRYVEDGRLTFVNKAYARAFGKEPDELIGKSFYGFIAQESLEAMQQFVQDIFSGRHILEPREQMTVVSDGVLQWQEWFNIPLYDKYGKIYEVQAIGHDISSRKRLEAEQARLDKIVRESYNEIYLFHWEDLRLEFANASALRNIGYERAELVSMKFSDLFNYPDDMALQIMLNPLRRGEIDRLQLHIKYSRKDGSYYDVDTLIQVLERDRLFVVIGTDITQKLVTEKKLLATILEKETLIREIHHRVKNNLQLISSIIYIKMRSMQEQEVRYFFEDTRQKIRSIALIHERLLQSEKLDKVEISEYLGKLISDLRTTNLRQDLELIIRTSIDPHVTNVDMAIYCGLIVNELITNAIKHAFRDRKSGEIEVVFRTEGDEFLLSVRDNGVTIPEDTGPGKQGSFGMQLLEIFVRQLGGTIDIIREKGTKFQIKF